MAKQPRLLVIWGKKRIAGTCRMLKFTSSTPVISHWTRLQMRSPPWSEASSVPHI